MRYAPVPLLPPTRKHHLVWSQVCPECQFFLSVFVEYSNLNVDFFPRFLFQKFCTPVYPKRPIAKYFMKAITAKVNAKIRCQHHFLLTQTPKVRPLLKLCPPVCNTKCSRDMFKFSTLPVFRSVSPLSHYSQQVDRFEGHQRQNKYQVPLSGCQSVSF
jgi:hypothetical protein